MHDDCYFYLYSECKLKERCRYRHNPLSKDNLILCKIWSKNKKCRMDCPLRHSLYHVVKQRSDTMCYWEDKGGCTKYRCEFKHVDSKKDLWKEPKVKLLTEIIESKNQHNSVISVNNVSNEETPDFTVSDASCLLVKSPNDKILDSDTEFKETELGSKDKEVVDSTIEINKNISEKEIIIDQQIVNQNNFSNLTPHTSTNEDIESIKTDNEKDLLVLENKSCINPKTPSFSSKEDSNDHLLKRGLVNDDEKPSKKSKSEKNSLDFDIESLDHEIAELEKLLNDS